jgi:hypothetical protein
LGFSLGYGFDAIAIALLGKSHPLGVILASILFAAMRNGATRMQFLTQMPVDLISMLQALILLFVAADAIIRYVYRIKAKSERVVLTRGWGGYPSDHYRAVWHGRPRWTYENTRDYYRDEHAGDHNCRRHATHTRCLIWGVL